MAHPDNAVASTSVKYETDRLLIGSKPTINCSSIFMEKTEALPILGELSILMHPHQGIDNHTYRLIEILYNNRPALTVRDIFDLGKYYDRMCGIIETHISSDKRGNYISAVLDIKNRCYGAHQLSSLAPYGK